MTGETMEKQCPDANDWRLCHRRTVFNYCARSAWLIDSVLAQTKSKGASTGRERKICFLIYWWCICKPKLHMFVVVAPRTRRFPVRIPGVFLCGVQKRAEWGWGNGAIIWKSEQSFGSVCWPCDMLATCSDCIPLAWRQLKWAPASLNPQRISNMDYEWCIVCIIAWWLLLWCSSTKPSFHMGRTIYVTCVFSLLAPPHAY